MTHKPMHQARQALVNHPKCGAKCRSGEPCKNAAMKNGRCRMHGGKSTGAPIKHGQRTKAAVAQRREDRGLIMALRKVFLPGEQCLVE
jgi:hypothetical protein